MRQKSSLAQISQEASTLYTVETAFGELATETGLHTLIDNFFNSLNDLSANATDPIWQYQVISDAEAMTNQFRTLGE